MFRGWDNIVVRFDVWHLTRRLARRVKTESHQLYGVFMAKLSACIFELDADDFRQGSHVHTVDRAPSRRH